MSKMRDIFGNNVVNNKFVYESAWCSTVGILRLAAERICYGNHGGKPRLCFRDHDDRMFDVAITAKNDLPKIPYDIPNLDILIVIGLARPWAGDKFIFNPRRCYLLVLNVLIPSHVHQSWVPHHVPAHSSHVAKLCRRTIDLGRRTFNLLPRTRVKKQNRIPKL